MAKLIFPEGQNYDCVRCAKGCVEDWDVPVDTPSANAVRGTQLELRVIQESGATFVEGTDGHVVNRRPDGRCVFLGEDKLCDIHRELGIAAKPFGCRQFPFQFSETPAGIYVGVSYFCTSVQENSGRPLPEHEQEATAIMERIQLERVGFAPIPLDGQVLLDWEDYLDFEAPLLGAIETKGTQSALSQAIRTVARAGREGKPGQHFEDGLGGLFRMCSSEVLDEDVMLAQQNEFVLASLFSIIEGVSDRQGLTMAYLEGDVETLPRSSQPVSLSALKEQAQQGLGAFEETERRYLLNLIHRKFLLRGAHLLQKLVVLYFLTRLLRLYTALSMMLHGRSEPILEDVRLALDVCEGNLATHGHGTEPLFVAISGAIAQQLGVEA